MRISVLSMTKSPDVSELSLLNISGYSGENRRTGEQEVWDISGYIERTGEQEVLNISGYTGENRKTGSVRYLRVYWENRRTGSIKYIRVYWREQENRKCEISPGVLERTGEQELSNISGYTGISTIEYHFVKFQKMWRLILTVRTAIGEY